MLDRRTDAIRPQLLDAWWSGAGSVACRVDGRWAGGPIEQIKITNGAVHKLRSLAAVGSIEDGEECEGGEVKEGVYKFSLGGNGLSAAAGAGAGAGAGDAFGFLAGPDLNGGFSAGDPGLFEVWSDSERGPAKHQHTSTQAPMPSSWRRRGTVTPL